MSELEELFQKILDRYPAQSKLELKILGVKERPEYGDKVIRRRFVLSVDMDSVVEMKCPKCGGGGKLYRGPDVPILDLNPDLYEEIECPRCEGTGKYVPLDELIHSSLER